MICNIAVRFAMVTAITVIPSVRVTAFEKTVVTVKFNGQTVVLRHGPSSENLSVSIEGAFFDRVNLSQNQCSFFGNRFLDIDGNGSVDMSIATTEKHCLLWTEFRQLMANPYGCNSLEAGEPYIRYEFAAGKWYYSVFDNRVPLGFEWVERPHPWAQTPNKMMRGQEPIQLPPLQVVPPESIPLIPLELQRNPPKNLPPPEPKVPDLEAFRGRSGESDWQVSVRSGVAPSTVDWIDDKTQQHHLWVNFSPRAYVGLAVLPGGSYVSLSLNGHLSVEQWENTAHGRRTRLTIRDYFYEDIDSDGTVDGMQDALGKRSIIVDRKIKSVSTIDWEKGISEINRTQYTFGSHKWSEADKHTNLKTESTETNN